ncbi:transposable element Tcb2 transposase [Trichonephila clavipes]|nr:transposable element Tcb2 transposase [Trichonephila clavipes]
MMEAGWSARRVARQLNRSDCVGRRCWDQWIREMLFTRRSGSGHPRQTSRLKDRHIIKNARVQPTASSTAIQIQVAPSLGAPVSSRTIRRCLAEGHLGSRCPLRVLNLMPNHRRLRLEWCRAQGNWTAAEWNQVIFSDKSRFNLSSDDNRVRVWRPRGERLNPAFVLQRHSATTAGVRVWGAIAYNTRSPLVLIRGTTSQPSGAIFQQDNARLRTLRMSQDYLSTVTTLTWPGRSPDLSPIEHIWVHLGRRVGHPTSLNELEARLQKIWNKMSQDIILNLHASMLDRIASFIHARRGSTGVAIIKPQVFNGCWRENYREYSSDNSETGELGIIPGTTGWRPVSPERVQQTNDAIATTSSCLGASMLQPVSARSVDRTLSLPWSTVHKVLHHMLRRYPYKIKMFQELKPHDDTLRINFANFFLSKISEDDTWVERILWTDEVHFTLPEITQDGAPPHITKPVKKLLHDTFGVDRVISRGFENVWPPRSPDLNPCDFYLWRHLKDMVYRERYASVAELKSSITRHDEVEKLAYQLNEEALIDLILTSHCSATRGLLATDHVILNHGQVTWTTPELAPPLLTTTPHQREDVSALDRFNVHRCPTRRVFSGTGLEPVTKQATVRYLYHSATAAIERRGRADRKTNQEIK